MTQEKIEKLVNNSFAKSIIELKLASDRIAEGKGDGAGVFTVKYQLLYLIATNGETSPQELIYQLNMAKSNLALIAKKMIADGLIVRKKEPGNKKQIYYVITDKGLKELNVKMEAIENLYSSESKEMLKHLNKTIESLKKVK